MTQSGRNDSQVQNDRSFSTPHDTADKTSMLSPLLNLSIAEYREILRVSSAAVAAVTETAIAIAKTQNGSGPTDVGSQPSKAPEKEPRKEALAPSEVDSTRAPQKEPPREAPAKREVFASEAANPADVKAERAALHIAYALKGLVPDSPEKLNAAAATTVKDLQNALKTVGAKELLAYLKKHEEFHITDDGKGNKLITVRPGQSYGLSTVESSAKVCGGFVLKLSPDGTVTDTGERIKPKPDSEILDTAAKIAVDSFRNLIGEIKWTAQNLCDQLEKQERDRLKEPGSDQQKHIKIEDDGKGNKLITIYPPEAHGAGYVVSVTADGQVEDTHKRVKR